MDEPMEDVAAEQAPTVEAIREKEKRTMTPLQLKNLEEARKKAVAVRAEKARAAKDERELKKKQAELERLKVAKQSEELDREIEKAKAPAHEATPEKKVRPKRRPPAPKAKRRAVNRDEEDSEEDDEGWEEWEDPKPAPPPRHAVPYYRPMPHGTAFEPATISAKKAYQDEIERMKGQIIWRSIWGRR